MEPKPAIRKKCTIVVPFDQEKYMDVVLNSKLFRGEFDELIEKHPELFPPEIGHGYIMKEIRYPKKSNVPVRRIEVGTTSYTVRPSFVTPHHTALTEEVEKAMFLRKFNVPFWALSYVFGKNPMFWYRIEQSIGRNSIVGTTVKDSNMLPKHLSSDEKHSRLKGEKVYVPTTVGDQCILGVSVSAGAGEKGLMEAYGKFKDEAQNLTPEYRPESVNTDGWKATVKTWASLFPGVFVICCFLHVFIKIRDRSRKKYKDLFNIVADKIWDCYKAESKAAFSQRVRRLYEWAVNEKVPDVILKPIKKLKENISSYSKAYDFPDCHRTSNMVDRLMQRMDRHLFSTFYFHGNLASAELSIRGWALIYNFAPCNPTTLKKYNGLKSPAERLNKFKYHDNWLQNLFISASMGGYKHSPPNPL